MAAVLLPLKFGTRKNSPAWFGVGSGGAVGMAESYLQPSSSEIGIHMAVSFVLLVPSITPRFLGWVG